MGELATNEDITMGENDWGMISKNPPMYESGVDNAVIEVTDTENKVHKITFKKGGVLNLGREDKTLFLAWDDSDTITFHCYQWNFVKNSGSNHAIFYVF